MYYDYILYNFNMVFLSECVMQQHNIKAVYHQLWLFIHQSALKSYMCLLTTPVLLCRPRCGIAWHPCMPPHTYSIYWNIHTHMDIGAHGPGSACVEMPLHLALVTHDLWMFCLKRQNANLNIICKLRRWYLHTVHRRGMSLLDVWIDSSLSVLDTDSINGVGVNHFCLFKFN